jgi:hypothetical protein
MNEADYTEEYKRRLEHLENSLASLRHDVRAEIDDASPEARANAMALRMFYADIGRPFPPDPYAIDRGEG